MKESNLKLGIIIDNLSSSQASYYAIKILMRNVKTQLKMITLFF